MNDREFLNQKAKDMTVEELEKAIGLKKAAEFEVGDIVRTTKKFKEELTTLPPIERAKIIKIEKRPAYGDLATFSIEDTIDVNWLEKIE